MVSFGKLTAMALQKSVVRLVLAEAAGISIAMLVALQAFYSLRKEQAIDRNSNS